MGLSDERCLLAVVRLSSVLSISASVGLSIHLRSRCPLSSLLCIARSPLLLLPPPRLPRHVHALGEIMQQPENVFLTNSSTGDVDWEGVRLGDFGSAVEMVLGGGTTVSGMHTR